MRTIRPVAILLAALLAGCTVLDPHFAVPAKGTADADFAGDLGSAIHEADQLRRGYQKAVGEQSMLRNGLAAGLIPLSAASLALGITSGPGARDTLVALGAGGAALLGVGSVFFDQGRQRVYLAGERAITCAVLAMRPALVRQTDYTERQASAIALGIALAAAEGSADLALLQRARALLAAAHTVLARIGTSGFVLRQQLHAINADVSTQLVRNEPDLTAILAIATGLKAQATIVSPGFAAAPAQSLGRTTASLARESATTQLIAAMDRVAPWVADAAAIERAFDESAGCTPALSDRPRLLLAAEILDIAPGQSVLVPIQPPGLIPTLAIAGPAGIAAALVIRNNAVVIEVGAAPGAAPGDRTLVVTNPANGASRSLLIRIAGPARPAAPAASDRPAREQRQLIPGQQSPDEADTRTIRPPSRPILLAAVTQLGLTPSAVPNFSDPAFLARVNQVRTQCLNLGPGGYDADVWAALAKRGNAPNEQECPPMLPPPLPPTR